MRLTSRICWYLIIYDNQTNLLLVYFEAFYGLRIIVLPLLIYQCSGMFVGGLVDLAVLKNLGC